MPMQKSILCSALMRSNQGGLPTRLCSVHFFILHIFSPLKTHFQIWTVLQIIHVGIGYSSGTVVPMTGVGIDNLSGTVVPAISVDIKYPSMSSSIARCCDGKPGTECAREW